MMINEQINQPDSIRSITISSNEIIDVFKISKDDSWKLCDFIVSNEDRLLDFLPRTREQNLTPNLSELFVSSKVKEFDAKQEFLFTLKRKDHKDIIGLIYIKKLDWVKMQGEFAYAIDYNFEGKGIVSKVIQEMSDFAFYELGLETLQIIAHKTNVASCKVAEKNNFRWVKTLLNEYTPKGKEPLDMELYELYK
tara:strand:+ start:10727 stop:11308 length:582 start_codon:yes stop_codon:yes gene_type:complete